MATSEEFWAMMEKLEAKRPRLRRAMGDVVNTVRLCTAWLEQDLGAGLRADPAAALARR
jgi:hypothetical protein